MTRILGLTPFRFSLRIVRTVIMAAFNLAIWYFLPSFLISQLQKFVPSTTDNALPIDKYFLSQENVSQFILLFAVTITVLSALSSILQGHALSHVFAASASLISAYYSITLLNGGVLTFSTDDLSGILPQQETVSSGLQLNSISLGLEFKVLFYLLIVPLFLNVVKHAWQAINESATAEVSMEEIFEQDH